MRKLFITTVLFILSPLSLAQYVPPVGPEKCIAGIDPYGNRVPCDYYGPGEGGGGGGLPPMTGDPFVDALIYGFLLLTFIFLLAKITAKKPRPTLTDYTPTPPPPRLPQPSPHQPSPPSPQKPSLPPLPFRPKPPPRPVPKIKKPRRGPIFGPKGRQRPGIPKRGGSPPYPRYEEAPAPPYTHEIPPSPIGEATSPFATAYPPAENLQVVDYGGRVQMSWDPPAADSSQGELVGYDVHRYESVPGSRGKEYRSLATLPPTTTSFETPRFKGAERYGVTPIYRSFSDGRIVFGAE